MSVVNKIYLKDQNGQEVENDIGADASNVDYTPTGSSSSTTVKAKIDEYNQHAAKKVNMQNSSDQGAHGLRYNATDQKMQYQDANNAWQDIPMGGGTTTGVMLESDYAVSGAKIIKTGAGGTGNNSGYIRAGQVDLATPGTKSTAEGNNVNAKGENSHAEGDQTVAVGIGSHAEGQKVATIGYYSHAEGFATNAIDPNSLPSGLAYVDNYGFAGGAYSHTEGKNCQTVGIAAHAEGQKTFGKGLASHAEGQLTEAIGSFSHAEGEETYAEGNNSHTEGYLTKATGNNAHAEGSGTMEEVMGLPFYFYVEASGNNSHAEGFCTQAVGDNSHVGGSNIKVTGDSSFAHGKGNDEEVITEFTGDAAFGIINAARKKFNESGSDGCRFTFQTTPPDELQSTGGLDATNGVYFDYHNDSENNWWTNLTMPPGSMYLVFLTGVIDNDSTKFTQKVYFATYLNSVYGIKGEVFSNNGADNSNLVQVPEGVVGLQIQMLPHVKAIAQVIRIA